jgi:hypothetical protein
MPSEFPKAVDNFPTPEASTALNEGGELGHAAQHENANDAIDAIETFLHQQFPAAKPPSSPFSMDDEFDDTDDNSGPINGLDAKWTWRNQGTAAASFTTAGHLKLTPPQSSGINWRIIEQNAPAGNYTIEAKFSIEGRKLNVVRAGLVLVDGTNGDFYAIHLQLDQTTISTSHGPVANMNVDRWNSVTSFHSVLSYFGSVSQLFTLNTIYARVKYISASTLIEVWISCDGIAWTRLISFTDAVGHTKVGLGISEENNGGDSNMYCDYFRRIA